MSLKPCKVLAPAEVSSSESLQDNTVSGNGCYIFQSDSDSEAESDSLTSDRLGVGIETVARFLSKINKNGPVPSHRPELGRCWLWTANKVRGYGQFVLPRTANGGQPHVYAHRFAYELVHGPLPSPDVKACHHCDVPLCCRPSHVFPGSQADNLSDARRKGRLIDGAHLIRVSDEAIADILTNYRPRVNGKALAAKHGISLVSLMRFVAGTARVKRPKPETISNVEPVRTVQLPIRGDLHLSQSSPTPSSHVSPFTGRAL